jgi:hypothetical protein
MKTVPCRFMLVFALLTLAQACSFVRSYVRSDYSDYKDFVYDHVVEARLFTDGEQRLAIKALAATQELHDAQEKVSPGFAFDYKADKSQVVVAVSAQNRVPLISDDLKFTLAGSPPLNVREFTGNFLVETLYPYAYPYYRVFLVDFVKSEAQTAVFQVLSSRGRLILSLKYGSASTSSASAVNSSAASSAIEDARL